PPGVLVCAEATEPMIATASIAAARNGTMMRNDGRCVMVAFLQGRVCGDSRAVRRGSDRFRSHRCMFIKSCHVCREASLTTRLVPVGGALSAGADVIVAALSRVKMGL